MPCSDVTEVIQLVLDSEDRLTNYELIKRSCGRAVGERTLMGESFLSRRACDFLNWSVDDFADNHPAPSEEEMFLQLKHFFAVQESLRVLLGQEPGGAFEAVRVAHVSFDQGNTHFEAEIVVDVLTEKIKSCGKCKGCGSIAKKLEAARG